MAKAAKPNNNMIEAQYTVIDGYPKNSSGTNNFKGLFDGIKSGGGNYYGGLTYNEIGWVEIELLEPAVFYRISNTGVPSTYFSILKKGSDGNYKDVSNSFLINDNNPESGWVWCKFTKPMPKGTYKFIGKEVTPGKGMDLEWFLERATLNKFLIEYDGTYKTYDRENNQLIDFTEDISEIFNDDSESVFINSINEVKGLLTPTMKIVSNKKYNLNINGVKENTQMIVMNCPISLKKYETIHNITPTQTLESSNIIKFAFSFDNGLTWKSYDSTNGWYILSNTNIPIKNKSNRSIDEEQSWNTSKQDILSNGIDSNDLNSVDFNLIDSYKLMFALVINQNNVNYKALIKDLQILYDSLKTFIQLNTSDCKVKICGDTITLNSNVDTDSLLLTTITNIN